MNFRFNYFVYFNRKFKVVALKYDFALDTLKYQYMNLQ